MTPVVQYNNFACFLACIESFLRDNHRQFDHQRFIHDNPDLFHGGSNIEGTCNSTCFSAVAERLSIGYQEITNPIGITFSHPNETILFGVLWNGRSSDKHIVRYYEKRDGVFFVMNPKNGYFEKLDVRWIIGVYKFSVA